jgi:hypothetical protein
VTGAEFARIHEDVGAEAMPLFDRSFVEAPDEHLAFLPNPGPENVTIGVSHARRLGLAST